MNSFINSLTPMPTITWINLRLTTTDVTDGVSVDYGYDTLNRLATVKDNNILAVNVCVTNHTYYTRGNLQSYSYPNGVTSGYGYNTLNRLTTMTVGTQTSTLASYTYTLGPSGNRTTVTELGGRTVNYTYDDLYRRCCRRCRSLDGRSDRKSNSATVPA